MPNAPRKHRPQMLKPRIGAAPSILEARGVKPVGYYGKTLRQRQAETGRTLALNGAAWRRLRASVLAEQPLCPECEAAGYLEAAVEVDHVDNDPTNNARENLQGLCKSHHSQKTQRDRQPMRYGVDGMPTDPAHPWNRQRRDEKSPATGQREPAAQSRARRRETGL